MALFRKYIWTWILLLIAAAMAGYLIYNALDLGEEAFPVAGEVTDFSMENVDGSTVSLSDTEGKVRLFYFYFTSCPDVCPVTTFSMSQVQELLKEDGTFGRDASFVSISFDPEVDTREKIKEFADRFKADYSGWYFLRGDAEETKQLARDSFKIIIEGDKADNFVHANYIGLVDKDNNLRKVYNASDMEASAPDVIARDVRTLVNE
ncbi:MULTISPECIES: SCO family protein [unclassified Paenibacillus]|uniref:SCO family protein n=1 Tax=Paenibacillus provencensis TaxID=441151 RepID=A0ABW3QFG5_9BACL|nr:MULTISPECIES: SCO family protein [unclassified Paenibacillus]MCM3129780.1 SCO family protein [Paenibacillus sp. MER 78]SFS92086.1 protein SCO1/2 [Paenibacillus sp. 453mf]